MKKSIAVVGQGFVGGSLTTVFAERGFDVYVYDKAGKVAMGGTQLWQTIEDQNRERQYPISSVSQLVKCCEQTKGFSCVYFVCLPTPMFEDGECDLSIVESVLRELASAPGDRVAVVKSTVPPGSTERWNKEFEGTGLRVCMSPEFLTEANALDDMRNQNRIIIGGPRPHINRVKQVFQSAFPSVPIVKTSSTNAELTKYVTNCFLAMKVSFANEMYQLCNALDAKGLNVDYDRVIECATMDTRLGESHWRVPGPMADDITGEPAFGYGGSCLCKDINALMYIARNIGIDPKVMSGSWQKNLEVRPQRDWEKLAGRAVSRRTK